MKKKNENGWTLIELIATITITGVVALFTIPAVGKIISDNSTRACKYYERAMIEAANSYTMKEETDIIEASGENFTRTYALNDLINYKYLEPFSDSRSEIVNATVTVSKNSTTKTYTITPHYTCQKKSKEVLYTK